MLFAAPQCSMETVARTPGTKNNPDTSTPPALPAHTAVPLSARRVTLATLAHYALRAWPPFISCRSVLAQKRKPCSCVTKLSACSSPVGQRQSAPRALGHGSRLRAGSARLLLSEEEDFSSHPARLAGERQARKGCLSNNVRARGEWPGPTSKNLLLLLLLLLLE